jgi:hypothetical protein
MGLEKTLKGISISAKESLCLYALRQYKSLFVEECLGFLDQRNQAKIK